MKNIVAPIQKVMTPNRGGDVITLAAGWLRWTTVLSASESARSTRSRPTILRRILFALHDSRRRQSERLIRYDYRHLVHQADAPQAPDGGYTTASGAR